MNEQDYAKLIARNLRRIFFEHDKTQTQVANDLGINKATLSSWMNGTRIPRMKKVDLLCHYFNCTRADIMEEHTDASWAYLLQAYVGDNKELQSLLVDVTKLNRENREIIAQNVSRLLSYQEGNKS